METSEDRKAYRIQYDASLQREIAEAAEVERRRDRDRHRHRRRSRSARGNPYKGSKGRGKQRKGESKVSAAPIGAAASASSRPSTDDCAIVVRRPMSVKIQLEELQTLESCLIRAMDSQKRTIDTLNFFRRMIDDERNVFTEARNVLRDLIFNAGMGRSV